jgi:DNA invertase Pin-like site-specific DNA recombinase
MARGIWVYCRVSTTKGEQELSLDEQERWAKKHASAADESVTIFKERASAKTTIGRPEFQRMIADLQELPAAKRPQQLAVTSLDRLSRDMTDTLVVARALKSMKVDLYVRDVGVIKAETFAQRAALVGQSMGGEAENEARSARARASWDRRRREGKPTTNKSPYGLQLESERDVPSPKSSDWVRKAFEWYAAGVGFKTIGIRFAEGAPAHTVRTPRLGNDGKPIYRSREHVWESNRMKKLLVQLRYRGTIVKPELFDRVQKLIESKPRWRQTSMSEYPLSGAVRCAGCGRAFSGHSSSGVIRKTLASGKAVEYEAKRIRYYQCRVCLFAINAERMESWFREQVGALTADERLLKRWVAGERTTDDAKSIRREIVALERLTAPAVVEAARSRVWDLAIGGSYAAADLERQLKRLADKAEADRARLSDLRARVDATDSKARNFEQAKRLLSNFWPLYERATYEVKRELMASLTASLGGVTATKDGLQWQRANSAGSRS